MSVLSEMSKGSRHAYNFGRALMGRINGEVGGLEAEVSQEITRRTGKSPKGLWVPLDAPVERRIDDTTAGAGAVATVIPPDKYIDILRTKMVTPQLGAEFTELSVSRGKVQLPQQTAATTVQWVTESNSPTASNVTIGNILFSQHTVSAQTAVSRRMIELGAVGLWDFVLRDLARGIAVAIDAAAIGTGATNAPTGGILLASGTTAVSLGTPGSPAYADLVAIEAALATALGDTIAGARIGFATTPALRAVLRQVAELTSGTGRSVWRRDVANGEQCLGYPAAATTQIPAGKILYGDWSQCIVANMSALDVLVNPFKQGASGTVEIYALQDVDVNLRQAAAFVVAA